jgi:uncharacterized protein YhbP (UPF0306 family)
VPPGYVALVPERSATLAVPQHVIDYVAGHDILTLATASSAGEPHVATFLYVNDGLLLFVWMRAQARTARHLEENPSVAFTIDEQAASWRDARAVQGIGQCHVVTGAEIALVADLFGRKYPDLGQGSTASIMFFRIAPTELGFVDSATGAKARGASAEFGAEFGRQVVFDVFGDLPEAKLAGVAARLGQETVGAGEDIVRQGDPGDRFYMIVDGTVDVLRADGGEQRKLASLGPGHFFGEMAILRGEGRSATVRATERTTVLVMEADAFRRLLEGSPDTSSYFEQVVEQRLKRLQEPG